MAKTVSSNLFDLIEARAGRMDQLALETSDATSLTYGALFERAGRAANALVALGVEPGDRVAAQVDKSTDTIVLALACLRAGAALLPLNTAYTLAELEYFLGDAQPALTVCRPDFLDAVSALAHKLGLPAVGEPRRGARRNIRRADRRLARRVRDGPARGRGSCGDPLHVRHDRPLERRDARRMRIYPRMR